MADSCEHDNEPSRYLKGGECLDRLIVLSGFREGRDFMAVVRFGFKSRVLCFVVWPEG